jgi:hypothetical protein
MSVEQNKSLMRRFVEEFWNGRKFSLMSYSPLKRSARSKFNFPPDRQAFVRKPRRFWQVSLTSNMRSTLSLQTAIE